MLIRAFSFLWRSRIMLRGCLAALAAFLLAGNGGAAETHWRDGYIPNVPVISQDGRSLLFYDDVLKGKVSIISFIYTSCRDICPVVTARLSQLEDKLGDAAGRDYFFVSISIDPTNDTPDKLKEYSKAFGAGPNWLFLTGSRERYRRHSPPPRRTQPGVDGASQRGSAVQRSNGRVGKKFGLRRYRCFGVGCSGHGSRSTRESAAD